jgi:hypothetical protein
MPQLPRAAGEFGRSGSDATGALLPTRAEAERREAELSAAERIRELEEQLARLQSSK